MECGTVAEGFGKLAEDDGTDLSFGIGANFNCLPVMLGRGAA